HRLTASLLNHLTGNPRELTRTLAVLASELCGDTSWPDTPALPATPVLPTTLAEITRLVDAGTGVRFGDLVAVLCPDSATAEHALTDLMTTAAISSR
ncbi:MAG: hypothetical protein ACRDS1_13770, partial [Pseudonocardiaceae bacterium]